MRWLWKGSCCLAAFRGAFMDYDETFECYTVSRNDRCGQTLAFASARPKNVARLNATLNPSAQWFFNDGGLHGEHMILF